VTTFNSTQVVILFIVVNYILVTDNWRRGAFDLCTNFGWIVSVTVTSNTARLTF